MSDPEWDRYAGVVSRAADSLGERGAQGFPGAPVPLGDPTRWGGRIEQHIALAGLEDRTFQTGQGVRVQCEDAYARLWQVFGVISADAFAWQAMGKESLWRSALLLLTFGAGQNTIEVAFDVQNGVTQMCGAYPFQGGGGAPFWGRQNGDLIACPFWYSPFAPLLPANALSARLETRWATGEIPYTGNIAVELQIAPYGIATGA